MSVVLLQRPNPTSGVPVYRQLMAQVKRCIATGALQPGERLPAIRPLAETLVISPQTIARAYGERAREGVVAIAGDGAPQVATANAGHNPPMLLRRSGDACAAIRLERGGPVLGVLPGYSYVEDSVTLATGDVLVAYTDGITEAMNASGEEWGDERLAAAIDPRVSTTSRTHVRNILHAVDEFVGGAPQHDDMTLVVVRVM